jgi:pantoate--beta-alanine ligase
MKIITSINRMTALAQALRAQGKFIGFVPTMGALHEGHLSLVRESRRKSDVTVVSIFVNPAQFGPKEDFKAYPRDLARDKELLVREKADCLFIPNADDMYPKGYKTFVEVLNLQDRLCGKSRPGHFRGVCTVVLKLLHIVQPDQAFFGWKDAQQVLILRKMVGDLNLGVKIIALPIVREADGLAMSSRNAYLNLDERRAALVLNRSLREAAALIQKGERGAARIIDRIRNRIDGERLARIDYIEIVDTGSLASLDVVGEDSLIALAVYIGKTRLIDNLRVSEIRRER